MSQKASEKFSVGDIVRLDEGYGSTRRVIEVDDERDLLTTVPAEGGGCALHFRAEDMRVIVTARTKPRSHGL